MDASTGWCRGCARTLGEIAGWGGAPDVLQRQVLAALPARQDELQRRGLWLGPSPSSRTVP